MTIHHMASIVAMLFSDFKEFPTVSKAKEHSVNTRFYQYVISSFVNKQSQTRCGEDNAPPFRQRAKWLNHTAKIVH